MNPQERAEQNIAEIKSSFGYWLITSGSLYVFFMFWHLFTHTSVKTCAYMTRIHLWGYESRSEELGMKEYASNISLGKVAFMSLITLSFNAMFAFSAQTQWIYVQTAAFYFTCVFLIHLTGVNLMKWLI